MRKTLILFLFLLCFNLPGISQPADPDNLPEFKLKCQGIERTYWLYLPEDLPANAPIVFNLHGYSSKHPKSAQFCAVAEKEKFALCLPLADVDPNGEHGWNVGYNMQKGFKTDDVKFLKKLARHLQKEYNLSRDNVFVTGVSNGGEMCYLLAYKEPDFFRAVAPKSGLTMKWMYDSLKPEKPVPLLEIHGTEDRTSEWNGAPEDDYWGPYIAVPLAVATWAVAAKCEQEITEELEPATPEGHRTIVHRYVSNDNGGIEVRLYEVVGAGHGINNKDLDYAQITWDFFKMYLK